MSYETMVAGNEIDELVARRVMGLKVVEDPLAIRGVSVGFAGREGCDLPRYSADVSVAWAVVEVFNVRCDKNTPDEKLRQIFRFRQHPGIVNLGCKSASEAALTICKAALEAMDA